MHNINDSVQCCSTSTDSRRPRKAKGPKGPGCQRQAIPSGCMAEGNGNFMNKWQWILRMVAAYWVDSHHSTLIVNATSAVPNMWILRIVGNHTKHANQLAFTSFNRKTPRMEPGTQRWPTNRSKGPHPSDGTSYAGSRDLRSNWPTVMGNQKHGNAMRLVGDMHPKASHSQSHPIYLTMEAEEEGTQPK